MATKGETGLNLIMNEKNLFLCQFHFKYFLGRHETWRSVDGSSQALGPIIFENHEKWKQMNARLFNGI